ncbi:hypothetical protein B0J11DRAFT_500759 [Dendryphion nanum]|uniref:Uncharacterized protein n=1 Tax=Dendryphion nanum TaxID=256645 RepID=A0A9P9J225_9PLEO|nr:hypothetical protein B0J11DRAFT_500759 [Dendryphion nanum]
MFLALPLDSAPPLGADVLCASSVLLSPGLPPGPPPGPLAMWRFGFWHCYAEIEHTYRPPPLQAPWSAHMSNCPSAQGRGMMIRETSVPGLSPVLNPYTSRTAHRLCCSTQVPCDNIENGPTVHFALSATEAACIRRGRRQHPSSLSKPTTSSSSAKQSSAPAASVSGFPSRRPLIHKGNSRFLLQFRRLCAPPHRETARVIPVIISHATSCGLSVDEKATVHSRVHAYIQTS